MIAHFYGIIFILCILVEVPSTIAQNTILDVYVKEALANNTALKNRQLSYDKSLAILEEAKGMFMPNISFEASYTLAGGGRAFEFPVGDLINPIHQTLNQLTEQQAFPTNINNVSETFLPHKFHETKLRIVQPVFQPKIFFNLKIQQSMSKLKEVERSTYEQELIKEVKLAYFQYLQTETALDIYESSEKLLTELLRVNKRLVAHHKALNDVVYSTQYEILDIKQQLQSAIKDAQVAKAYFNFLLNRPLDHSILIDSFLVNQTPPYSLDALLLQARSLREEFQQYETAIEINSYVERMNQANKLPSISLVADAGFQGFGYKFNGQQDFWLVNLSLSWDLFQGGQRSSKVQQAKIESEILQNQSKNLHWQIQLQVSQALHEFHASSQALNTSKANVQYASERYRILKKQYNESMALFIDVQDARTKLTQAQLAFNIAQYDLLKKQVELQWVSGNLPIKN